MAISRRLRFEILRRDNYTCRYCGASAPDVKLTIDHVVPTTLGGSDEPPNLVTACEACNGGKSSIPADAALVDDVNEDAVRWSAAIKAAADEMLADLKRRDAARVQFDEAWSRWGIGQGSNRNPVPRPDGWEKSVDAFLAAGLPMPVLLDCIRLAMTNKKITADRTFRYMCGIAWKKVKELQDEARKSVESTDTEAVPEVPDQATMYRKLVSHVFGVLPGIGNAEDVNVMALLRTATFSSDDEELDALDAEGHAACELISRACSILADYRQAAKMLLGPLPEEKFNSFCDRAVEELNWHPRVRQADGGALYREALGARMFLICAQELIKDSQELIEESGEASE
ncbi:MAG: HNH endonuclease [Microbispora sp.]|nr:HNH endonuclease [Microbispora sp.]